MASAFTPFFKILNSEQRLGFGWDANGVKATPLAVKNEVPSAEPYETVIMLLPEGGKPDVDGRIVAQSTIRKLISRHFGVPVRGTIQAEGLICHKHPIPEVGVHKDVVILHVDRYVGDYDEVLKRFPVIGYRVWSIKRG
jgi:hypothetical protein